MVDAFGSLSWNAELGWWSGRADIRPGHAIDIHVQAANDPGRLRSAVGLAEPGWVRLRASEPSVRAAIADQMVEAHNGYCDPEDEVTAEQFAGRLRLLSALFEPGGAVELCYHDGMLFGGHWIIVPIDTDGCVGEATEAG
jgi:hypothetical protein